MADKWSGSHDALLVWLFAVVEAVQSQLQGPVREVICSTCPALTQGKSLLDLNRDFMQKNRRSLGHMISGRHTHSSPPPSPKLFSHLFCI